MDSPFMDRHELAAYLHMPERPARELCAAHGVLPVNAGTRGRKTRLLWAKRDVMRVADTLLAKAAPAPQEFVPPRRGSRRVIGRDIDALYAYVWENDKEVKKNSLQGFRRDTIELNMLQSLYKGEYDENSIDVIVEIPYSNGQRFEMETNNDYKTSQGIRVPLFEARAPFESYLGDLNKQELVNLVDRETKLDHFPGLKVGDVYAPNNNGGNWE